MMLIHRSITKIALSLLAIVSVGCTRYYEEINTNPYEVTKDEVERDDYNISASLVSMQGWVVPTSVNTFQFTDCLFGGSYGGYIADSNSGFVQKFSTYDAPYNWLQVPFTDIIPQLYPSYVELLALTDDEVALAVAEVIKVSAMVRMCDVYGPIPYTKIGGDGELSAPYDSQSDAYNAMFDDLDAAIEVLVENQSSSMNSSSDNIYGGNVLNWARYANSLKLRMAMRVVYADETLAKTKAEEAVSNSVGTMVSNSDNAFLSVTQNPFKVIMYDYNGGDSRIGADITSYMNGYSDPRRAKYFTTYDGTNYNGLRSGITIPGTARDYSNMVVSESDPLMWMNVAEICFLKAEGALRGWSMGGTAEEFYTQGITLSFEQWGASGVNDYLDDSSSTPEKYVDHYGVFSFAGTTSTVKIKWDDSNSFETMLEQIITQKWIANFPLGQEAWSEFRRTGYPNLMNVVSNNSGGIVDSDLMARRLSYPLDEYTENADNLNAAISSYLGGPDNLATRVWWDCNPRF